MASSTDILRLTDAAFSQTSYALYNSPVSSAQGLSIAFDFYSYGGGGIDGTGPGADGISFFLIDGSQSPKSAGGFGGSLGYAPLQTDDGIKPGIQGGYVGIGFDEFGFYSDGSQGRTGGIGITPDAVAIRGSAANSYKYLAGTTSLFPGLDVPGAGATRAQAKRRAEVDLSPTGELKVFVDLDNNNVFDSSEKLIDLNLTAVNGALPSTFRFGFAASTGSNTNIHEIGNFTVRTSDGTPISGEFVKDLVFTGGGGNENTSGGSGNDIVSGGGGNDKITGLEGDDKLIGGPGADTLTGGPGADRFVFQGGSKAEALRSSTLKGLDRIVDFKFSEGDRFQLDFDNNLNSFERPKGLFNSGKEKGSLKKAVADAYADKDQRKAGNQALRANEAIFFRLGSKTYLSVNDKKAAFDSNKDLVADVTGISFRPGDSRLGSLSVGNYFI